MLIISKKTRNILFKEIIKHFYNINKDFIYYNENNETISLELNNSFSVFINTIKYYHIYNKYDISVRISIQGSNCFDFSVDVPFYYIIFRLKLFFIKKTIKDYKKNKQKYKNDQKMMDALPINEIRKSKLNNIL